MGNENEHKRDPAENRRERMGHPWDDAKTGGGEKTVGLTGAAGSEGGAGGSVGSTGVVGGSPEFLAAGESEERSEEHSGDTAKSGDDVANSAAPSGDAQRQD